MSDDIRTIVITLEEGIRDEYVEKHLIPGIQCMEGVLSVDKEVSDHTAHFALVNARRELGAKLWEVLYPTKE